MITYQQFIIEGTLSNYEYVVPKDLEKAFYDFYVWAYLYQHLDSNPHIGNDTFLNIKEIVTDALTKIIVVNTKTMKDALLLSITFESQHLIKYLISTVGNDNLKELLIPEFKFQTTSPVGTVEAERFRLSDISHIREKINMHFENEIRFIRLMKTVFENASLGGAKWSQICTALIQLYEKRTDLKTEIRVLDNIYDLEHNTGPAYNKVIDMDWAQKALDFKFSDKQFKIAEKSSVPEYVTNYIFHQLGAEKDKRNKTLTAKELEIHSKHSDAYILFLKTIENNRRNPEMEEIIKKEPTTALEYIMHILKFKRWPEAEPYILQDLKIAIIYAKKIIHARWPELEKTILDKKNSGAIVLYAREVLGKRWIEAEHILYNSNNQKNINVYKELFNIS